MRFNKSTISIAAACLLAIFHCSLGFGADEPEIDLGRWYGILHKIQNAALEKNIGARTINAVIQEAEPIPEVIRLDNSQAEFTMTLEEYISRTVSQSRIVEGGKNAKKYPSLLSRMEKKYGVPKNVLLALWGMESNYGASKGRFKLSDSFLTLIYDGRRGEFFTAQLLALMKIADKNNLKVEDMRGSWAGAMGHYQFIPTTLAQYGADGNGNGRIDIVNSISDAMASAGNYLSKLGWNKGERIVRKVILPADFDRGLCDGRTKKHLTEWTAIGVWGVPKANKTAGMICGETNAGYLAYENFYRLKKWNNSNHYAVAVALLADRLK